MKALIVFLFAVIAVLNTNAQDDRAQLLQLMNQDSTDINTLAAYPEKTRQSVFDAAAQPQALVRLGDMQKRNNEQFKNLVSSYSKEEQQKIWNLTTYNNLIHELVTRGKKSQRKIEKILKNYPVEVHDDALNYGRNYYGLLVSIDKVNEDFSKSFADISKDYPPETQGALRDLINTPEVITILDNNMHMTVALGDYYKRNPAMVKQEFDSLNLELARQKAKDAEEWKETMKNNPQAADEMKQAAQDYAKENGYKDYNEGDPVVVEHHHYYPYPLWCGYPWWYDYPYWYPYPYWYHWGFYYHTGIVIWIGPPSWYFVHWHFHHHPYFYNYPHLTDTYFNYYYGPRRSTMTSSREVHQWVRDNRPALPRDFMKTEPARVDRIREYGKMEEDIGRQQPANPQNPIDRKEYVKNHAQEFPHLQERPEPVVQPAQPPRETPAAQPEQPTRRKPSTMPGRTEPQTQPSQQPRPRVQPVPRPSPPVRVQPRERPSVPQPSPQPSPQPRPQPAPRQPAPAPRPSPHDG